MTKLAVGAWVRCEREAPSKGTWPRYAGRVGRVLTFNPEGGEWGVKFTAGTSEVMTWFLSSELVVIDRPAEAPNIRTDVERRGATGGTCAPRSDETGTSGPRVRKDRLEASLT